mgnify:CR=1 FL=1
MNIQEILLNYKHITAKINAQKKKNNAKTNLIAVSKTFPAENIEPVSYTHLTLPTNAGV